MSRALVALIIAAVGLQTGPGRGSISGRVIDGATGLPIAGIEVYLESLSKEHKTFEPTGDACIDRDPIIQELWTDQQGRFSFTDLPAGIYQVASEANDYLTGRHGQRSWNSADRWLSITQDERLSAIDVAVWPRGTITGRVMDEQQRPVANIHVEAIPTEPIWIARLALSVTTDDRGYFAISAPPGRYVVQARSIKSDINGYSVYKSADGRRVAYRTTWHPGTSSREGAAELQVQLGQTLEGIDVTLRSESAYSVTVELPAVLAVGHVQFRAANGVVLDEELVATGQQRLVNFQNVPPGRYLITASLSTPDGLTAGLASIVVTDRDVTEQLPLMTGARIVGRVRFESAGPRPDTETLSRQVINLCHGEKQSRTLEGAERSDATVVRPTFGKDDRFEITGLLEGRYLVAAPEIDRWSIRELRIGERVVIDRIVNVPPSSTDDALIVLTDRVGHLAGRVEVTAQSASTRPWVTVFPAEPELWGHPGRTSPATPRLRYMRTGTAATFAADLPGGDYYVIATNTEIAPIRSRDEYARLVAVATKITLVEDSTLAVTLRTHEWTRRAP